MRISDRSSDVCSSDLYADAPGQKGLPLLTPAQLRNKMVRASMDKFQVAVHAIGDAANAEALDAIADLNADLPGERRWRIEHAQIVDPADIPRFKQLGVIALMQPTPQPSAPSKNRKAQWKEKMCQYV